MVEEKLARDWIDETEADSEEVEVKKYFVMLFSSNIKKFVNCKAVLIPENKKFYLKNEKPMKGGIKNG